MQKKIFITGSTGYIGTRVCRVLTERGYEIYAAVRKTSDTSAIKIFVTEFIECDLLDPFSKDKIITAMKAYNIRDIISMTGSVDYHDNYAESRKANVETVENISDAAAELQIEGLLDRILFVSSVLARGFLEKKPSGSGYINETTDLYKKGKSVYCDVKREAEDIILAAVKKYKIRAVIVQPGSLVGKAEGNTTTTNAGLVKKIVKGFPVLTGGASYASVHRVAEGIVSAFENGQDGDTYLLGGENITMKDFALLVKKLSGEKFPEKFFLHLPLIVIPVKLAYLLGKRDIFINYQQAVLGSSYHYIDYRRAEKKLGYKHAFKDLEEEIAEILEYENC